MQTFLDSYEVDPSHYFTTPRLSFDTLLKYTNVKLDYIEDPDILLFIENDITGGISTITKRYAKANITNVLILIKNDKSYITYLDAYNLYGWAMSQYLPTGNFKWIYNDIDVTNISDESKKKRSNFKSRLTL